MKKKQQQSSQILSPENYIRQRARSLPIFKCFVNEGWEESSIAHVTVGRNHINGNITWCSYLVDLGCLGVKDTMYQFNVPEYEFNEYRSELEVNLDIIEIDYNLAHNIIHAGWEYAEEVGFEPHKDFLSITSYMLEEDSDDIPLVEIACGGENGKPVFMQGPFEDDAMAKMIINRLEKNLGAGNFDYVLAVDNPMSGSSSDDEWDDDGEWDDEDFDDFMDDLDSFREEYAENSHEENVAAFLELTQYLEEMNLDDAASDNGRDDPDPGEDRRVVRVEALADLLYQDIVDFKDVGKWLRKWEKEAQGYAITNAAFSRMLGLQDDDGIEYEDLSYLTKEKEDAKLMEYVREKWGELPYVTFLELQGMNDVEKRKDRIAQALDQYPDHPLLKLEEVTTRINDKRVNEKELSFKSFFGNRKEITSDEYLRLQFVRLHYFIENFDLAGIESLILFSNPQNTPDDGDFIQFAPILYAARISVLRLFLLQK
ncbi:hypothetical protein [Proteiniphilum sp.]|uniref:hypothetical protein n=1 Tax=Proteiniphilum sp. TaxID=1926877 RepID=UPI00332FB40E